MSVVERQSVGIIEGFSDSVTPTLASALVSGNLTISVAAERSGGTGWTINGTGWNEVVDAVQSQADSTYRKSLAVYYKFVQAGDPTSVTMTSTAFGGMGGFLTEWEGTAGEMADLAYASATWVGTDAVAAFHQANGPDIASGNKIIFAVCYTKEGSSAELPYSTWSAGSTPLTEFAEVNGSGSQIDISIAEGASAISGVNTVRADKDVGSTNAERGSLMGVLVFTLPSAAEPVLGQASADFGGTFTSTGVRRVKGQATASFGGTFTASGSVTSSGGEVTKTFTFATTAEGFAAGLVTSGVTLTYDAAVGNPAGSLKAATVNKNVPATENYWEWVGTWEDLGVPAGKEVTSVQMTGASTRAVTRTSHATNTTIGPYTIHDNAGTQLGVLWAGRVANTQEAAWVDTAAQTAITLTPQPSNTTIRIRLRDTIATGGGGGSANIALHDDQVALKAVYTAGVVPPVTGVATADFGGAFSASGVVRKRGVATADFGGAFLASGNKRLFGTATASFGGAFSASGVVRRQGVATADFGGTFVSIGVVVTPAVTGVATADFGGTFTASGVVRKVGTASADFGGSFLASGNKRRFGAATASFGFTATSSGVTRKRGTATASFGFTSTVVGRRRVVGVAATSFGGDFAATGTVVPPAGTGTATADFGFTASATGVRRTLGQGSADFGGAFLAAGNQRRYGQASVSFGGVFAASGLRKVHGSAAADFGGTFSAISPATDSTTLFAKNGVFVPLITQRASGGVWVGLTHTKLSI